MCDRDEYSKGAERCSGLGSREGEEKNIEYLFLMSEREKNNTTNEETGRTFEGKDVEMHCFRKLRSEMIKNRCQ